MKTRLAATLTALALLALPASAQTLSTLLPTLSWPDDTVTTSTKGCDAATQTVCTLRE
ncbi:MAG: hypothetical protein IPL38_13010 [Rhodobacter sp.]|mgnify:CR=1 FL=1|jgi:hypothetical protein|nr:hypothetical protein [Rhodobacter sp.]MBK8440357.1 hypothetical protein [Rhodobacter sp.]